MVVVFASSLLISAGLLLGLRASAAGRLWAAGHLLLSAGGLGFAANAAAAGKPAFAALAAGLYALGKLIIYRGVRVHQGLPVRARMRGPVSAVFAFAAIAALTSPEALVRAQQGFCALFAVLSAMTLLLLARGRLGRSEIGLPLAMLACAVQLAVQLYGIAISSDPAASVAPFYAAGVDRSLVLASLVAVLLGLFGYTVMALEQVIANKEHGARIDGLTGLLNRAALDESAATLISSALRHRQALTCLVIDVDHFKQVNDLSGHRAGDAVLQAIAEALDNSRRASDVAGRYGGEEFCVLCPHTDEQQATALARRILRKVRAIPLPGAAGAFASVSIGIAQLRQESGADTHSLWMQLFGHADCALYEAKRQGRDRYLVASTLMPESGSEAEPAAMPVAMVADQPGT
ncbi:GGDEF domain-containing protein [Cupriavidus sp. AU9028]|nr:GGDEF domain-containing protein [Cupriavidus sp. AU9028]MBY4896049.1 GGDEF domain-containing protein [Cupriavidus sp. AU9028]